MWIASPAHKGIAVQNLVRLGVLCGRGKGLLHTPKYKVNYFVRGDAELRGWAREVDAKMRSVPNGPYNLCVSIFGASAVQELVGKGHFPVRTAVPRLLIPQTVSRVASGSSSGGSSSSKRIWEDSDSDDERRKRARR